MEFRFRIIEVVFYIRIPLGMIFRGMLVVGKCSWKIVKLERSNSFYAIMLCRVFLSQVSR